MYHYYKKENPYLRRALYEAYGKKCVYCGEELRPKDMQVDHILATNAIKSDDQELNQYLEELRANGFDTEKPDYIENYILCCASCNLNKNNQTFEVSNLRFYHDMAEKKTEKILSLIEKHKKGTDVSDFTPENDVSIRYLEPDLKEYILQKFNDYKTRDISVRTPQLLLMLLTYPGKNIVDIFNAYEMNDGRKYGEFLIDFFCDIDKKYEMKGQSYREEDWTAFLRVLEKAKEVLRSEKYKDHITANMLCFTILNYREGATINMIQNQMGIDYFEQLKVYVLEDRIPSIFM